MHFPSAWVAPAACGAVGSFVCVAVERSDETPPEMHHEGPLGTEISRAAESGKAGVIGSTDILQACISTNIAA